MSRTPRGRRPFTAGVLDIAPILIGVFPFGLIAGIGAVEAGLDPLQAYAPSVIVFAGAAQLAMMDLIARDAAPLIIVATALVINARFAMYSAALAPAFHDLGPTRKAFGSFVITDQAFAVSVVRFDAVEEPLGERFAYFMGASIGLWVTWQVATILGVVVGAGVPTDWSLDFAIPLVFIALLFPAIKDRSTGIAAVVAAGAAVALVGVPLNLGLMAATGVGIVAGLVGGDR